MTLKNADVLCDQTIDVALVVKEAINIIDNVNFANGYPQKFVNRINSVVQYCYNLFMNASAGNHTTEEINDLLINLMNVLVQYKNSYNSSTYGYKVMNSLLDIVKNTFVELN